MKKFLRNSILFILLLSLFGCNSAARQTIPVENTEDINLESHIQVSQEDISDEVVIPVDEEDISDEVVIPVVEEVSPAGESGSRIRSKDGMEMVYVPEGTFEMGSDVWFTGVSTFPVRQVWLDAFWVDKYEVNNAQYQECVNEGWCTQPQKSSSFTRENYYGNSDYGEFPVLNVNWLQAFDYCDWAGAALPTEAQWEKAARGTDGRQYPWGNQTPNEDFANYGLIYGDTLAVGSFPQGSSPYGALDMAGNANEWVYDFTGSYHSAGIYNPRRTDGGNYRGMRGGSYGYGTYDNIRSFNRFVGPPDQGYDFSGFRCVYPEDATSKPPVINEGPKIELIPYDGRGYLHLPAGEWSVNGNILNSKTIPNCQICIDCGQNFGNQVDIAWTDKSIGDEDFHQFDAVQTYSGNRISFGYCWMFNGAGYSLGAQNQVQNEYHEVSEDCIRAFEDVIYLSAMSGFMR